MQNLCGAVPYEPKEVGMNAGVAGEFGMERSGQGSTLSYEYGIGSVAGEDFNSFTDSVNSGSSNKDHF